MHRTYLVIVVVLLASLFLGCANQTQTAKQISAKPTPPKNEYVDYTPTGSWISKKVKKTELATTQQQQEQTQDAMRDLTTSAPGYNRKTER